MRPPILSWAAAWRPERAGCLARDVIERRPTGGFVRAPHPHRAELLEALPHSGPPIRVRRPPSHHHHHHHHHTRAHTPPADVRCVHPSCARRRRPIRPLVDSIETVQRCANAPRAPRVRSCQQQAAGDHCASRRVAGGRRCVPDTGTDLLARAGRTGRPLHPAEGDARARPPAAPASPRAPV